MNTGDEVALDFAHRRKNHTGFLPDSVLSVTGISCSLSVLGALVIFLSYCLVTDQKNKMRRLLMYLTIADLMTACGNLVGTVRYGILLHYHALHVHESRLQDLCVVQSFVTTYSSLASFFWTLTISITLILTLIYKSNFCYRTVGTVLAHVLCWMLPLIITLTAASFDVLGENFVEDTGPWCWIKGNLKKRKRIFWMTFTGKGWELLIYILTAVLFILLIFFMRRQRRQDRYLGYQSISYRLRNEDENFSYIWLVIYLLRCWGTLRFFLCIGFKHIKTMKDFKLVLLYLQAFGDSAQAFFNCILFVFLDKSIRIGMWNAICKRPNSQRRDLNDNENTEEQEPLLTQTNIAD